MNGKLYLCATPIGNLGDVSARCLEAFNNADLFAAEDTRRTLQLLNNFEISIKIRKLNMTKRPSVSEAKIKSIFNFIVYQEVLDSCIFNMVC